MSSAHSLKKTFKKVQEVQSPDDIYNTLLLLLKRKNPEDRLEDEIDPFLPTLMKKTRCFRNVERDVVAKILKNSELLHVKKCDVIITQEEFIDKCYVVLRGSVGVYGKEPYKKTEESESSDVKLPSIPSATKRQNVVEKSPHVDIDHVDERKFEEIYGSKINILQAGQSFGALLDSAGCRCKASIIAEEETNLLVIDKSHQHNELLRRRLFVKTHPFFVKWTEAQQEDLVTAIKKHVFYPRQCPFHQGSDVTGLHFLVKGKAHLSVVPDLHKKQYPAIFDAVEMSKKTPVDFEHRVSKTTKLQNICEHQVVQRLEIGCMKKTSGLSTAEHRVELCEISEGDIIHDVEVILNLSTSLFRVVCSKECVFYSLDGEVMDRLILRNTTVLALLKTRAETKLSGRISTITGKQMEILPLLKLQFRFIRVFGKSNSEKKKESTWIHRLPLPECLYISEHYYQQHSPNQTVAPDSEILKYLLKKPDCNQKLTQKRWERWRRFSDQIKDCKSLDSEVKSNTKQRYRMEKTMKRFSLGWIMEGSWMTRNDLN